MSNKNYTSDKYCQNIVRDYDYDRYIATLCAKKSAREALWALFAFNHEIAKTRDVVTETQLGLIRLQWWRESLELAVQKNEVREHAVLAPLCDAAKTFDLPLEKFESLIYAREFDLEDVAPESLNGLINYADFTNTPLLELAGCITGVTSDNMKHLGTAYGLVGLARSLHVHARARRCYLPTDLLKRYTVRQDHLFEGKPQDGVRLIIKDICEEAARQLNIFKSEKTKHPFKAFSKLTDIYIKQIKRADYDAYSPKYTAEPSFKAVRIL